LRAIVALLFVVVTLAACGSKAPTSPSTTTPGSGSAGSLLAAMDVKADATGARDAVAAFSEVIVDMSGSTGTNLTYSIDFGDGFVATTATARHVYAAAGTYVITGSVTGETRVTGTQDRAFIGSLVPPRGIRLTAEGGVTLEGTLPGKLNDAAELWALQARGDSADGQRLEFRAIAGEPTGEPPVADMQLKFGFSKTLLQPFQGLSPVEVDGSASRGVDLSYFLEFGDGVVATTSQATRVFEHRGLLTARVTVVDRFGRVDSRSFEYGFDSISTVSGQSSWVTGHDVSGALGMSFPERTGTTYEASVSSRHGRWERGSAVMSGDGDVRATFPTLGIEYRGNVTLSNNYYETTLTVVQHGGENDGRTFVMRRTPPY
jgi:PKD repeat protein